jgi:hypothetical protein
MIFCKSGGISDFATVFAPALFTSSRKVLEYKDFPLWLRFPSGSLGVFSLKI